MTFLPIVERELRVAARRRGTYWSRLGAAALAIFLFAAVMGLNELGRGGFSFGGQLGLILFSIFSWLSFAFVCAAGVFLTADSLSEEKREGTLGLLFLTDLRGYDVVLGKLFSHSLVATYGLLAAFPVIGIAFLVGGVTGGEFWRLVLVLFNTLFFSLTAGVLISAVSRDAQKAMSGAALLCGLIVIVFPLVDSALAGWDDTKTVPLFSFASPAYTLSEARSLALENFWTSLAVVHGLGWTFLVAASLLASHSWQETAVKSATGAGSRAHRWRFGSPVKRTALRVRWLAENPARWLAARDLWMGRFLWLTLAGSCGVASLLAFSAEKGQTWINIANGVTGLLAVLMNLWLASAASRFFVDAMRTGTMELLLATPLAPSQIVRGQWWALCRAFLWPMLALLLLDAAATGFQIQELMRSVAKNTPNSGYDEILTQQVIHAVCSQIQTVTGLFAVAWFGMWMGMTSRKANHAVIKTLVFVQVLPFVMLFFANIAMMMTLSRLASGRWPHWLGEMAVMIVSTVIDAAFVMVARRKLLNELREMAVGTARARSKTSAVTPMQMPKETPATP
jgi:ABC-type transport system involved in multi-copper enzyme maturation permease subunit